MKIKIATLAVVSLLLAACSSSPPKVGMQFTPEYAVVVSDKSSDALKDVAAIGAIGIRDLTQKEFSSVEADVKRMSKVINPRGGTGLGYEVGTGALAYMGGVSLSSVVGLGLASSLFSDGRPDNYKFAADYYSRPFVYAKNGVDVDVLRKAQEIAYKTLSKEIYNHYGIKTEPPEPTVYASDKSYGLYLSVKTKNGGLNVQLSDMCKNGDSSCIVDHGIMLSNKRSHLETIMAFEVAVNLPEGYFIYLPPNRSYSRLPMIVSGGSAEVRYLVEKNTDFIYGMLDGSGLK